MSRTHHHLYYKASQQAYRQRHDTLLDSLLKKLSNTKPLTVGLAAFTLTLAVSSTAFHLMRPAHAPAPSVAASAKPMSKTELSARVEQLEAAYQQFSNAKGDEVKQHYAEEADKIRQEIMRQTPTLQLYTSAGVNTRLAEIEMEISPYVVKDISLDGPN